MEKRTAIVSITSYRFLPGLAGISLCFRYLQGCVRRQGDGRSRRSGMEWKMPMVVVIMSRRHVVGYSAEAG